MSDYFDEHNCEELKINEHPNHYLDLARLLIDSGINELFQYEYEQLFSRSDGRKQPAASKKFIENLKQTNEWNPNEKCSICLKILEMNLTKELPCHHRFCQICIEQWLNLINNCPLCRLEFPTDDQDYENYKKQKLRIQQREENLQDLHHSMFS